MNKKKVSPEKETELLDVLAISYDHYKQLVSDIVDACSGWISSDETLNLADLIKSVEERAKPENVAQGIICGYIVTKYLEMKKDPLSMLQMLMRQ